MALPFQSSFQTFATDIPFPNILDAKFTALTVRDTTENEPTLLLEVDEPFAVEVAWSLSGVALCSIGGTWWVALFIDDIDGVGATSGALGAAAQIPVNGCQADYTTTFNIPANSVSPGVYQLELDRLRLRKSERLDRERRFCAVSAYQVHSGGERVGRSASGLVAAVNGHIPANCSGGNSGHEPEPG